MWHKAAKVSDIADGQARTFEVTGTVIALFCSGGKFYAMDNRCPHRGGPLVEGHVEDNVVTCPWHAWQFDITSGKCQTMPGTKQKTYPVKIDGDIILINIE